MTAERIEPPTMARPARRPELDAIRILVVVGLVFFHSALVFDSRDDFYVKNAETTDATMIAAGFGVVWAMPMLFLIAGLGSWHSLRRRGPGRVRPGTAAAARRAAGVRDPHHRPGAAVAAAAGRSRLPRVVPAVPAALLRRTPGPGRLPLRRCEGEYFETGHLWFVVLLLAFSLLLAPLARLAARERGAPDPRPAGRGGASGAARCCCRPSPLAVISALLGLEEAYAAWSRWAYLLFFLYGFVLAADERFRAAMRRDARAGRRTRSAPVPDRPARIPDRGGRRTRSPT